MPADFSVIEGPYLTDILDQPAPSTRRSPLEGPKTLLETRARLQPRQIQDGSSDRHGLVVPRSSSLASELIKHGLIAMMVETSELVHYKNRLFDPKNLIVAVSQSGESAEIVRLS